MRKQKEQKTGGRKAETTHTDLKDLLLSFFNQNKSKTFTAAQLRRKLSLRSKRSEDALYESLYELVKNNTLAQLKNGSYKLKSSSSTTITGVVDHVNPRYAFIVSEEAGEDIWVNSSALKGALDGDTVKVAVFNSNGGKRKEGEVIEVLQHKKDEYVGTIEILAKYAFVVPDNKKMYSDIYVKETAINGAKEGEKVLVKITQWPTDNRKPEGEVIQVLGKAGEHNTEMHAIMAEFGLPFDFPERVVQEAEKIEEGITKAEIAKRRDFRDVTTFTIDR
jgi:ribonuclease R